MTDLLAMQTTDDDSQALPFDDSATQHLDAQAFSEWEAQQWANEEDGDEEF